MKCEKEYLSQRATQYHLPELRGRQGHRGHRGIYYGARLKDPIKKNVSHRGHREHRELLFRAMGQWTKIKAKKQKD